MRPRSKRVLLLLLSTTTLTLAAENLDDLLGGFEEENARSYAPTSSQNSGLTGSVSQEIALSPWNEPPHHGLASIKSALFLDYEHKFDNGFKFKTNAKAYHDFIYSLRGHTHYTDQEREELEREAELFDAYIEGSLRDDLDIKVGRQVVVWGRSDTVRITDILNPLDNRRPGMVDIEDLRLPTTMAKLDYFVGDWRITPIAILEQRFSKLPPFGGDFNPSPTPLPKEKSYDDITPALSIGGEFSDWDINLYAARTHHDTGYLDNGYRHDKATMVGTAINLLSGSWLFKSEVAHFDGLRYTALPDQEIKRTDMLLGTEYNGIADTQLSYDVALRAIHNYHEALSSDPLNPSAERSYQHAFRASSEFVNATFKANYLISLFGSRFDQGGFQRLWFTYDINNAMNATVGIVDYIGGSQRFDAIDNNDQIFAEISYNF
ncbi:MAG TPA: DUF1302 family protein [Campylobacterales bacterium]|nr:DUF1302 family protein [Campylobacterales bacterium]